MNGSELRKAMDVALQATFVPALRQRGFQGSPPHFRRIGAERVDVLTVQFNRHGGSFVVEISSCSAAGYTNSSGKLIPAKELVAHHLHPRNRHRLGSPRPGQDGRWFRFDDGCACRDVADQLVAHLEEAERWWADEHWKRGLWPSPEDLRRLSAPPGTEPLDRRS